MSKIVSNSEIHLHHCLWGLQGHQNWKKQPPEMFSRNGVLKNFAKLTKRDPCPSPTRVFYSHFYEIFENTFFTEHFFEATAFHEKA